MPTSNANFELLIGGSKLFRTPRYSSNASGRKRRHEEELELRRSGRQTTANKAQKKPTTNWTEEIRKWIRPGQKPLGEGNSAKTIGLDSTTVVKLIPVTLIAREKGIEIHQIEKDLKKEFQMHESVQAMQLDDGHPCVPQLQSELHFEEIDGERYAAYKLDRLEELGEKLPQKRGYENVYERCLKISRKFVQEGYLHNDLHQANVMKTISGKLCVIDLGNMRRMPNHETLSDELLECIYFGQTVALYDNCNANTSVDHFVQMKFVQEQLRRSGQIVQRLFGSAKKHHFNPRPEPEGTIDELKNRLDELRKEYGKKVTKKELIERIRQHEEQKNSVFVLTKKIETKLLKMQSKNGTPHSKKDKNFKELVMQLVLATLSTHYFAPETEGQKFENIPVCHTFSNYIYAIRNPPNQDGMTTIDEVYDAIMNNKDFHD